MMDPLERERFEAWLVIVAFYSILLGSCGFVLWLFF